MRTLTSTPAAKSRTAGHRQVVFKQVVVDLDDDQDRRHTRDVGVDRREVRVGAVLDGRVTGVADRAEELAQRSRLRLLRVRRPCRKRPRPARSLNNMPITGATAADAYR